MAPSCRCFATAAQDPADGRAHGLVRSMRTAKPTTWPSLALEQFGSHSLDVLAPRFRFLGPEHPTDPLVPGKRREVLPGSQGLRAAGQDSSEVLRDRMHDPA